MKKLSLITASALTISAISTNAAISYVKVTNDADSGISTLNTYTHTLDFQGTGSAATINSVSFDAINGTNVGLNFTRAAANGTINVNNATGEVSTSGGLADLMQGFIFNGDPSTDGTGLQTFILSGLTAGTTYSTRIYTHAFAAGGSRNNTIVFDHDGTGGTSESTGSLNQDDATTIAGAGFAAADSYYINYEFTAVTGEDLVITAANANGSDASFHLYGLTNQVVPEPSSTLLIGMSSVLLLLRRRRA